MLEHDGDAGGRSPRLLPALQALHDVRDTLPALGVEHVGIFGSVARGDDRPDSDVDILLAFPDGVVPRMTTMGQAEDAVHEAIQDHLPGVTVDVVVRSMLRSHVRDRLEREIVYI